MNQAKEFLEYLLNAIKIWIIVQPWERGLRVRNGKYVTKLKGGIYFRIPYLDTVFIQSVRLRIFSLPIQTLTSKDLKTITVNSSIGYSITDVEKLYNTLFHPELTLTNMAMSEIAKFVYENPVETIQPNVLEETVIKALDADKFGIKVENFKLINFAVVRTYRLIQDHSWSYEGLEIEKKS